MNNQPFNNYSNSGQNNNDYQRQRQLDADRQKQTYKMAAEQALDHIARDYQNAQANNLKNWKLDPSDKAAVIRYYKRYWDSQFISISISILILTFLVSFYTKWAVFGIFAVFIFRIRFSQPVFLRYLLNDHELTGKQITEIKDKIFYKQLETSMTALLTAILILVSYSSLLFSKSIYLAKDMSFDEIQKLVSILSKPSPFYLENELFAYFNVASILVLMLLKIYEKWSK
ncbi:MAG: hypothetical protein AB1763_02520 [Campylobacterota bacterium]